MNYSRYCTAKMRGGLDECLDTELDISKEVFEKLVASGIYFFYAYDNRIHADRYMLSDISHNIGLPGWLHGYRE